MGACIKGAMLLMLMVTRQRLMLMQVVLMLGTVPKSTPVSMPVSMRRRSRVVPVLVLLVLLGLLVLPGPKLVQGLGPELHPLLKAELLRKLELKLLLLVRRICK